MKLKVNPNLVLEYDPITESIKENGVKSDKWSPVFIPGKDEGNPDFFGFLNKSENKVYDVFKNVSGVTSTDNISI